MIRNEFGKNILIVIVYIDICGGVGGSVGEDSGSGVHVQFLVRGEAYIKIRWVVRAWLKTKTIKLQYYGGVEAFCHPFFLISPFGRACLLR